MPVASLSPRPVVTISTYDTNYSLGDFVNGAGCATNAAAVINQASVAFAYPLYLPFTVTGVKLWCVNGATVNGNVDIGIYNSAFAKLVSMGSTAQSGASQQQVFDNTDLTLPAGLYYIAFTSDSATGTFMMATQASTAIRASGALSMAAALPLPTTYTPTAWADGITGKIVYCGLSARTVI